MRRTAAAPHPTVSTLPAVEPPSLALFQREWWLEAVAPGRWQAVSVLRDGAVAGYLPYVEESVFGLRLIRQPQLTPALGPWIQTGQPSERGAVARRQAVLGELIERLPAVDHFRQKLTPSVQDVLPFIWAGFDARVRYTYRLEELDDLELVWSNFESQRRRAVARARRTLEAVEVDDLEPLVRLSARTFARRGLPVPYDADVLRRIVVACADRGVSTLLLAIDARGEEQAGVCLLHDGCTTYYLLGGHDDSARATGAMTLLLWEAIECAAARGTIFDFEGSTVEPIGRFFRSFGALPVSYFEVARTRARAVPVLRAAALARRQSDGWRWPRG